MAKKPTTATKKEIELFHTWLATEDPLSIATHLYVDADAVFSAALLSVLKPDAQVLFVPADSEIEDTRKNLTRKYLTRKYLTRKLHESVIT